MQQLNGARFRCGHVEDIGVYQYRGTFGQKGHTAGGVVAQTAFLSVGQLHRAVPVPGSGAIQVIVHFHPRGNVGEIGNKAGEQFLLAPRLKNNFVNVFNINHLKEIQLHKYKSCYSIWQKANRGNMVQLYFTCDNAATNNYSTQNRKEQGWEKLLPCYIYRLFSIEMINPTPSENDQIWPAGKWLCTLWS